MTQIKESLVDIEDCVGVELTPSTNNHVLPKVKREIYHVRNDYHRSNNNIV